MAAATQEEEEMISGINVTPLVDITLVFSSSSWPPPT